jgi:hypothetical protein
MFTPSKIGHFDSTYTNTKNQMKNEEARGCKRVYMVALEAMA